MCLANGKNMEEHTRSLRTLTTIAFYTRDFLLYRSLRLYPLELMYHSSPGRWQKDGDSVFACLILRVHAFNYNNTQQNNTPKSRAF